MTEFVRGLLIFLCAFNGIYTTIALIRFRPNMKAKDYRAVLAIFLLELGVGIGQVLSSEVSITPATVVILLGMGVLLTVQWTFPFEKVVPMVEPESLKETE